jgi:hypothetical protein
MSRFENDDEPHTIRITATNRVEKSFVDAKTEVGSDAQTEVSSDAQTEVIALKATAPEEPTINEIELFKGLRTMVPFFLEVEIAQELSRNVTLSCSDESPPFVNAIWEDARAGGRAMLTNDLATTLRGCELPFCGLLGCYRPSETKIVLYNQGIDWVLSLIESDLRDALPRSLSSRPFRALHLVDEKKLDAAFHDYLRWLIVTLAMIHELGHAIVHLAALDEHPWEGSADFQRIPLPTQEHLAQCILKTALSIKELTAPFPASDLNAVFHRLTLDQTVDCRRWVRGMPWSRVSEIEPTLGLIRSGEVPASLLFVA